MIDATIGVIPPRNELNSLPDKKTENFQDKKSEFESHLKESNKKDSEKPDRAFGGTKKKMHEDVGKSGQAKKPDKERETEGVPEKKEKKLVGNETVLNSMASIENVNKTPDSEVNPDSLKKADSILSVDPNVIKAAEVTVDQAQQKALAAMMAQAQADMSVPLPEGAMEQIEAALLEQPAMEFAALPQQLAEPSQVQAEVVDIPLVMPEQAVVSDVPIEMSEVPVDNKVLETLNREQMFQKLEAMKKTEVSTTAMEGLSNAQISASQPFEASEHSDSSQDENSPSGDKSDSSQQVGIASAHLHKLEEKDFATQAAATHALLNKPAATKETDESNLKEVLNQAQYLVTKGGGEVSVKMTPEGMGEVQLKVMLENGRMNVEMNTHDKNIQKLIQDNLSDLKSSLAAHQISVEHVTLNNKISTVYDVQNANHSQNFTDGHAYQQQSHQRDQRQQAGRVFEYENSETMKAMPSVNQEIKKASAHRVYQTHKAHSLNAVA